jgi:hypothetical protein
MIRVTGFVHARAADPTGLDRLAAVLAQGAQELDVVALHVSPTASVSRGAGELMVLAAFADMASCLAAARAPYVSDVVRPALTELADHVEVVRYEQGPVDLREPGLRGAIQRTLLLHVDPAAGPDAVADFERALVAMPCYIDEIRNSSASRVDAGDGRLWGGTGPPWTHVWEQELHAIDDLTGPYMVHPYHWSYVDTWFDPQAPNHLVDTRLVHAACALDRSILALA